MNDILDEHKNKLDYSYLKKWAKQLGVMVFWEDELKSLGI